MASSALQIPAAIKSSSSAFSGRLPSTNNIGSSTVSLSVGKMGFASAWMLLLRSSRPVILYTPFIPKYYAGKFWFVVAGIHF
ncbi:unnamed protein product [Musa hybrid cultivar]